MPNPPKPTEEKRRLGNPGKRALPAVQNVISLPMAIEAPEPPRPLGVEGMKLWKRIWEQGRTWISSNSDLEMVTLLCESMDERSQLRFIVLKGTGDWRDRVALRSLDSQLQTMLSLLGMSPTDRAKLGVAEVQARTKIQDLLLKRDAAKEK
jgi:phage terminase small subunit